MGQRLPRLAALIGAAALAVAAAGCANSDAGDPAGSSASTSTASPTGSPESALRLVVIGDSIPYNDSVDCPGCTGFVDRYAEAIEQKAGRKVDTANLSEHNGLTLPMLMDELESFKDTLGGADVIIVGIAHNSFELNSDKPCGTTFNEQTSTLEDWAKVTARCAASSAAEYRPQYDELFATIASWRDGRPTLLRTINRYNDWNGWEDAHLTPDQERRTVVMLDAWNRMLCRSAEQHDFACADIYHAFNGADGTRHSGDLLAADYTHPSDQGNARIAQVLIALGTEPLD